MVGAVLAQRDC